MEKIKSLLIKEGASEVGFAGLRETVLQEQLGYPFGISIAVALNPLSLKGVENGPTKLYYQEYERVNKLLDDLSISGAKLLTDNGYRARSFAATNE